MTKNEIIESEVRTSNEDLFKINLYLVDGWWRAYEWSAYLLCFYPNGLKDSERLKCTRKRVAKTENGIVFNGLKMSSFPKYIPDYNINENDSLNGEEKIVINVEGKYENITFETYKQIFNEWKDGIEYKDTSMKCGTQDKSHTINGNTIFAIAQQILAYPIEDRTPMQNTNFISELKQNLSKII